MEYLDHLMNVLGQIDDVEARVLQVRGQEPIEGFSQQMDQVRRHLRDAYVKRMASAGKPVDEAEIDQRIAAARSAAPKPTPIPQLPPAPPSSLDLPPLDGSTLGRQLLEELQLLPGRRVPGQTEDGEAWQDWEDFDKK